jgi:hypothetical protein
VLSPQKGCKHSTADMAWLCVTVYHSCAKLTLSLNCMNFSMLLPWLLISNMLEVYRLPARLCCNVNIVANNLMCFEISYLFYILNYFWSISHLNCLILNYLIFYTQVYVISEYYRSCNRPYALSTIE